MTNPFDPLSQQLNDMNSAFMRDPSKAQKAVSTLAPNTLEALAAQRVLTAHAKQKRKLQEELFMNKAGNPDTTVNDDLKTNNVKLANDLTALEYNKAEDAGNLGRAKELEKQNALNRLIATSKNRNSMSGIGTVLNNPTAVNSRGVNTLQTANMGRPQPGGITPSRTPMGMGMPTFKGAGGGIVAFKKGNLVEESDGREEFRLRMAALQADIAENEEKDKNQTPPIPSQNQTQTLQQAMAKNPKGQPPAPEEENEDVTALFKNVNPNDPRETQINQMIINKIRMSTEKQKTAEEAALAAYGPQTGFTSDAFINRLTAMEGQGSVASGLVEGQRQAAAMKREDRDKLTTALSKIRGEEAASSSALIGSLLSAANLGLETDKFADSKDRFEKEFGLKESVITSENAKRAADIEYMYKNFGLATRAADLKEKIASIDAKYKDVMGRAALLRNVSLANDAATRLAGHRQDLFESARLLYEDMPVGTEEEKKARRQKVVNALTKFENQVDGINSTFGTEAREALKEYDKDETSFASGGQVHGIASL